MMTPPIAAIGAVTMSVQLSSTRICSCCTSLVVRVIRVGAPKPAISRAEKRPTAWNTPPRTSRPNAIAVRAPNQTAMMVHTTCSRVIASMTMPTRTM